MLKPKEFSDEWFNIFVLHQNRVMRGPNNHLPEEALDEFLDLVIWGHEHECRVDPEWNDKQRFHVIQPGKNHFIHMLPVKFIFSTEDYV